MDMQGVIIPAEQMFDKEKRMKEKHIKRLMEHFDRFFGQSDAVVIKTPPKPGAVVDIMVYAPNQQYPYWKLVSLGASDYRMPGFNPRLGNRNEYIMFIDPSEDMLDEKQLGWYRDRILELVNYTVDTRTYISYGHSIEWEEEAGEDMVGAYIELPQIIPDTRVLHCKLGLFRKATCLQIIMINKAELDLLLQVGSEKFSYFLYPENGGTDHFICEKKRSARF